MDYYTLYSLDPQPTPIARINIEIGDLTLTVDSQHRQQGSSPKRLQEHALIYSIKSSHCPRLSQFPLMTLLQHKKYLKVFIPQESFGAIIATI